MKQSRLGMRIGAGAVTVAAMLATVAVPAVLATANAKPDRCATIYQAMSDSIDMAQAAYAAGNTAGVNDWMDTYNRASRNYARWC